MAAVACLRAAAIAGASPLEPHWVPGIRYQLREAAAELEQRPDHPIAQAITRALAPGWGDAGMTDALEDRGMTCGAAGCDEAVGIFCAHGAGKTDAERRRDGDERED
jgi:hypothetical protein